MEEIQTYTNSLVGMIVPFLTQLARAHMIPCSGKGALYLSLAISVVCVCAAFVATGTEFTGTAVVTNIGLAFTISQGIYRQFVYSSDVHEDEPGGEDDIS